MTSTEARPGELCDQAAQQAARESGVPVSVLRAITRTETGRARSGVLQPWPWTVNMEGAGKWFASMEQARSYVQRHYDRGARSFDVGCFQINYKWHGTEFTSIEAMFDPQENAAYAARFLRSLFAETGDWTKAAGAYHSRTPKYAERYAARFARIRETVDGKSPPAPVQVAAGSTAAAPSFRRDRTNTYPLLQATGSVTRFGSLVPLTGSGRPALIGKGS